MKLLIIGGTQFVGRAMTEAALAAGHEVTLFNRGNTNPDLFPEVEKLRGDRGNPDDLKVLEGRTWDVVIDTCGYVPRMVDLSAKALADSVEQYVFISTISAYERDVIFSQPGADESAPLATIEDETTEEINGETYGPLKVLCEQAAEAALPGRTLIIRPGLIVGPHDHSERFPYWPVKVDRQNEILAPPLESPIQVIDVRDLADWTLKMSAERKTGAYNATGPDYAMTFDDVLTACREAVDDPAELVVASEGFLLEQGVQPWVDLQLWLPEENQAIHTINVSKAINDGLTFRPIGETIRAILDWYPADSTLGAGLSAEREAELLAAWKKR